VTEIFLGLVETQIEITAPRGLSWDYRC